MKNPFRLITSIYAAVCSVTLLVMLTTSFELFQEKYLPSFMLAQKYALPLVVSAMAAVFVAFFEPERLDQKRSVLVLRFVMAATLLIFSWYLTTLDRTANGPLVLALYAVQWCAILAETVVFLRLHPTR